MAGPIDSLDPETRTRVLEHYSPEEVNNWLLERSKDVSFRNRAKGTEAAGGQPAPKTNWEGVDVETGAPALDRFLAGFKSGPTGRLNSYAAKYPTRLSPGGDIEIMHPETRKWTRVDEEGFSPKDLLDLPGDAMELVGMMLGGAAAGPAGEGAVAAGRAAKILRMLKTAGGGAAAGNMARQAVGQATPGEEDVSLTDPVKAAAGAAALSYTPSAKAVMSPSGAMVDWAAKQAAKAGTSDVAKEGLEVSRRTGIPLNIAEITQDPSLQTMLGFAHRSGFGQVPARQEAAAKESAALAMFGRLLERLGGKDAFNNPNYAEAATGAASTALKDIEDKLRGVNYHFMERPEGAMPTIPLTNRTKYLQGLADRYRSMGSTDQLETAKELERIIGQVQTEPTGQRLANPRLMQQMLQESGEEGFGGLPEKAFPRLAAMRGTRESRGLWHATRQDLVEASKTNPLAAKLLEARTRTGELLTQREALQKTPLLAFLNSKGMLPEIMKGGRAPAEDTIIPHLLEGMRTQKFSPGETSNMTRLLQSTNPGFVDKLGQAVLADAVKAGFKGGKFSYKDAVEALPPTSYLHALYKDIWNPGQRSNGIAVANDVNMMLKALDRISKFGLGIPHGPASTVTSVLGKVAQGDFTGAGKQAAMNIIYPIGVSKVAFDPKVREQLLTALSQGGRVPPAPFISRFLGQAPVAGAYEAGSVVQQRNQAGFGGSPR